MAGYPSRYVVFDTETKAAPSGRKGWDIDQTLRLGCMKVRDPLATNDDQPRYADFKGSAEFFALLDLMPCGKEPIYIFAHNIGFDLRIVEWFRRIAEGHYSLFPPAGTPGAKRYANPLFVVDGSPTLIRCFRGDGQRIMLYDTFNWYQMSLAKIGESLGFTKGEMPPEDAPDHVWYDYCRRDVDVADKALRRLWGWLQTLRVTDWDPTPASQAMSLYRMRFEKKRIKRPEDKEVLKLDRWGYYGGRVECFRVGVCDQLTYQVDINGLYPRVMLDGLYPCEVLDYDHDGAGRKPPPDLGQLGTTAEVFLDSDEVPYPVRGLDGITWARGRIRTVLAGPELVKAWSLGHIDHVGRWTHYRLSDLFTSYTRWLWRLRTDAKSRGDTAIEKVAKSLLNSLHGKFGQRDGEWQYAGRTETPRLYATGKEINGSTHEDVDIRILDGHRWWRGRDREHPRSFVPIAAWCASYGRVYMDDLRAFVGPDDVLYQATDCLIVTEAGYRTLEAAELIHPDKLGFFKTEDIYRWIQIDAPNQISHDHGIKRSGLKTGATESEPGHWSVEQWSGFADDIFQGNVSRVSTRKTCVNMSKIDCKRLVLPSGSTEPHSIDNWSVTPETQLAMPIRHDRNGRK